MRARYFLPEAARFISADTIVPDPMNPQSFNRYSYVRNSPINFSDPTGHSECGVGHYQCGGDIDRFAELKNQYVEGNDFVFGPSGSFGVQRYVELEAPLLVFASVIFPFEIQNDGSAVFDLTNVAFEGSIAAYFAVGGGVSGQLDLTSFSSPHLFPNFEAEIGTGFEGKIGGFEAGAIKSISWNTDGTQSIEYGAGAIAISGAGGVSFDPNAEIVRPSEKLARDLAAGKDAAWQQLYRSTYGSSSVLSSTELSFINTVPSGPIFTDYGRFLPINFVYTGY